GHQSDAAAVLRQLQHEKGLVPDHATHPHRKLEHARDQRRRVDGTIRWRRRKNHETWISAGEHQRSGLWQCRPCSWSFVLERSGIICITVSQVNQAAAEDDAGAKTETDGSAAAAEVNGMVWTERLTARGSR